MKNITWANYVLFVRFDVMIGSIIESKFRLFFLSIDGNGFFVDSSRKSTQKNDVDRNFIDVIIKIISKQKQKSHTVCESAELDGWTDIQRHRSVSSR